MKFTIDKLYDKEWKIGTWLLVFSYLIYLTHFTQILLSPNAWLSSITGDSLKNYYTFIFFTRNDDFGLFSNGMNFPYGEHIIFTDCIPLLALFLKLFPFIHDHLAGALHLFIFFSFIVCPLIYYAIFKSLQIPSSPAFIISLGVSLLSPQMVKIEAGHLALTFGFVIPLSILLLIRYFRDSTLRNGAYLMLYNFALFLLHPYHGLSVTVFCFITMGFYWLISFRQGHLMYRLMHVVTAGILPLVLIKLFLLLTDNKTDRTEDPWGSEYLTSQPGSLLVPGFGPLREPLTALFGLSSGNFEGVCYLGAGVLVLSFLCLLAGPFFIKKHLPRRDLLSMAVAGTILLLISFGVHNYLISTYDLKIGAFAQFRAPGRFSWFIFYLLPVFVFTALHAFFSSFRQKRLLLHLTSFFFLAAALFEGYYYFSFHREAFWHYRNFFSSAYLNEEEKQLLNNINDLRPQAILPIPMYHTGSDVISRGQSDASMLPSTLLSVHSKLPILSNLISRTSVSETINAIELLNSYKIDRPAANLLSEQPFIVVKSKGDVFPDEDRVLKSSTPLLSNDSLNYYHISKEELLRPKIDEIKFTIADTDTFDRWSRICFVKEKKTRPYVSSEMTECERAYMIDVSYIKPGRYVFSFRYHYPRMHYKSLGCHLIVGRFKGRGYDWIYNKGIQKLSGFYNGYAIYEDYIDIETDCIYEFLLQGIYPEEIYHISHFMLRPAEATVFTKTSEGDTLINNFPQH